MSDNSTDNKVNKDDERTLREVLESLDHHLRLRVSYKFIFMRGILYGLGTVVGATILIAVISWLLAELGFEWITDFFQNQSFS